MILDGLEDNTHIVDAILMGALVFVMFTYYQEYFGKNTMKSAEECGSTIIREGRRNANAGIGSNCSKIGNFRKNNVIIIRSQ